MFKFINGNCPYYLNEVFEFAPEGNISLRNNFLKLKRPFRNTNTGQKALSFIGPSFWNQIPETLKKTDNLNTFKHNLKKHFFNQVTWFLLTLPLLSILLLLLLVFLLLSPILLLHFFPLLTTTFFGFCWGTPMKIKLLACFVLSLPVSFYIHSSISRYSLFFTTKVCQNCF